MAGLFDDLIPKEAKSDIPSAGMFDDLLPEAKPQGLGAKAISPITNYLPTQQAMDRSGRTRMSEGIEQASQALAEPHGGAGAVKFVKGVGNVALGGLESVASPVTAAYRTFLGKPVEDVTGIPKEYTEFGAQLLTPGLGLTRLPRAPMMVAAPKPLGPGEEVAAAGQRLGVDLPRAVTTDSPSVQQIGKAVTNVPIAGTPLRQASEAAIGGLGDAAQDVRAAYGSGSQAAAGAGVRQGITDALKSGPIKQKVEALYDRVDNFVNPTVTADLVNTRRLVGAIDARRTNAGLPKSGAAQDLEEALSRKGMNYEGVKDLRTHFGEMMDGNIPIPQGMSSNEVRQIYGSLSNDMRLIIARAGGQDGLRAYQQAENAAKRWVGIREDLGRILKVQSEEAIFSKIEAMAGSTARADVNLLGRVRGAIGPQHWDEVASSVIDKMGWPPGGTGFSPDQFLTAYNKMSDEGRRMLFRSTGSASHADAIDDIAKVSERFKQLNKFANPSGTGQAVAGMSELASVGHAVFSGGFIEPLTVIGTIGGGRVLSSILAKPASARAMATWSQNYAAAVARQTPATINQLEASTKIFAATIGRDFKRPDLSEDFMRMLQKATSFIGISPASADELIPPPRNPAAPADWAQNAVRGVAGKLGDIVAMPRRAMESGITTEGAVPWATDTAMMMTGGASPFAPRGALTAGAGSRLTQGGEVSANDFLQQMSKKYGAETDMKYWSEVERNRYFDLVDRTSASVQTENRMHPAEEASAAILKGSRDPGSLVEFARSRGMDDAAVKALIDDRYSSPRYRAIAYQEYLAAKTSGAGSKMTQPAIDIPGLSKQLEQALFSENTREEFPALFQSLKDISAADAKALAKEFTGRAAESKDASLKSIWNRYQGLEVARKKSEATGGRSAF